MRATRIRYNIVQGESKPMSRRSAEFGGQKAKGWDFATKGTDIDIKRLNKTS